MIPDGQLVLLDTSIVVHLARDRAAGRELDRMFRLRERRQRPLCSIVSVGEIHRLAIRNGWGDRRRDFTDSLLQQLVVVDLGFGDIVDRYGQIGAITDRAGTPMQPNDLWIAATASASEAVLLTTDADFRHVPEAFLECIRVDQSSLP